MKTHRTVCKVGACEKFCGLLADVEQGRMARVRFDPEHPVTQGIGCIKGTHVPDYQNDPDRLLQPQRRTVSGWEAISWDRAASEIGEKLHAIHQRYGPNAIATYWGNASDSSAILLSTTFCHAFGSPNSFNVLSLEYTDRGAVAGRLFGNEHFILQPDVGRAEFALLLGTNPWATQGITLLQRRPQLQQELRALSKRGKLVVVDPRRTQTAKMANEHFAIRPGTDLFLLLGMIRRILQTGAYDQAFVERHTTGVATWLQLFERIDLDDALGQTGIPQSRIENLADEFAAADGAFVTTRVGVQTSPNTTLTEWAVMTLNAITGNIDRPGGVFFNPGAVDVTGLIDKLGKRLNKAPSRIGKFPQIFGGPPASVFADDVLSDDPDRIRALVVVAGNPVISFPNTAKMEQALQRLDLLVCIDIYRSDTGAFAHYNLPAATAYEKGSVHFMTSNFEPYPYVEYQRAIVKPRGEARPEWDIYRALSRAAGVPFLNDPWIDRAARLLDRLKIGFSENLLYRAVLPIGLSLRRLRRSRYGVTLGDIPWGKFLSDTLQTPSGRIELAPQAFVDHLITVCAQPLAATPAFPFLLISGARRLETFNSWTHNIPALTEKVKGNWATLNTRDAQRLGVADGDRVRITSSSGALEIGVRLSDDIREGVVAVHQFWGHHYDSSMRTSKKYSGVNVNRLHDDRVRDAFCGMPVFNGTPCRIECLVGNELLAGERG
jgi:anaerobic selenocysteine-containing dehydrogenase